MSQSPIAGSTATVLAAVFLFGPTSSVEAQVMTARDLLALPQPAPDTIIGYGPDSSQVGELFLPRSAAGSRLAAVTVLIHGGCWLSEPPIRGPGDSRR